MGPEAQYEEFDREGQWAHVYYRIREETRNNNYSLNEAKRPEYRGRNRYRDVSPYDHSRVVLQRDGLNYINASLVKAPEAGRQYILTQGPLEDTAGHFWLMAWENNSRAVLMLNRIIEKGVVKCYKYFPMGSENHDEDVMDFPDVGLRVAYLAEDEASFYTVRHLQITDLRSGESKELLQFHYTTWPDFDVPTSPASFLTFLHAVRASGALGADVGPPLIHCSAGIGRSGTFCLVDTSLVLAEQSGSLQGVDVVGLLLRLRQYRMGLIQTPEQLRFSYRAIIHGARDLLGETETPSGLHNGPVRQLGVEDEEEELIEELCEEDDEDFPSEPPPPPPPRVYPSYRARQEQKEQQEQEEEESPTTAAAGSEPLNSNDNARADDHRPATTGTQTATELRRRKREDRVKKMSAQIDAMKAKQAAHEKWSARRPGSLRPVVLGLSLAALLGSYFVYRYYLS